MKILSKLLLVSDFKERNKLEPILQPARLNFRSGYVSYVGKLLSVMLLLLILL